MQTIYTIVVVVAFLVASSYASFLDSPSYYEILEISTTATLTELKSKFRKRSLQLHPDKNRNDPDADSKFHALHKAYETLRDSENKRLYDKHGHAWEDIKEYQKKHLVSIQRQMFRRGHQMYMKNVEIKIEEPFMHEKDVFILHQSFVDKYVSNFDGIWVIFFGNPNCGPCKQLAPKIKKFARAMRQTKFDVDETTGKTWLRVGAVNMALDDNLQFLQNFGSAGHNIPQIILLAPNTSGPYYQDYEIVPASEWRSMDATQLELRLATAAAQLRKQRVKSLPAIQGSVADMIIEEHVIEKGTKTVKQNEYYFVMAISGSQQCQSCSGLRPVFRRLAASSKQSGFQFRTMDCHHPDIRGSQACAGIYSFPTLLLIDSSTLEAEPNTIVLDQVLNSPSSEKYGYEASEFGFDILLRAILNLKLSPSKLSPTLPKVMEVKTVPDNLKSLKADYELKGMHQGKPYWKAKNKSIYLRWLPSHFRNNMEGAWIVGDELKTVDQGWAFLEEDLYVPVDSTTAWNVFHSRFSKDNAFKFLIPNASENSDYFESIKAAPTGSKHDEL